jgi:hypothetical protein
MQAKICPKSIKIYIEILFMEALGKTQGNGSAFYGRRGGEKEVC